MNFGFGLGRSVASMGPATAALSPAFSPNPVHMAAAAEMAGSSTGSFCYYSPSVLARGYTPKHLEYELLKQAFYEKSELARESGDKTAYLNLCNDEIRAKSTKNADASIVQPIPLMTNFSVKYANPEFIGLNILPVCPSEQESGEYTVYRRHADFDVTRNGAGRGTRVQSMEVSNYAYARSPFITEGDSTLSYIGKDFVLSTGTPVNGMFDLRERVDYNMAFKRELRIRDVLTNTANYSTANRRTLTAGTRWDDPGADPGADILAARAALWTGTGSTMLIGWTSIDVWNVLRQSANLLKLLPLSHQGYITPQIFCEIFGLDGLMVSESRIGSQNVAKQFANPTFTRVWGKYFGLTRVSRIPQQRNAAFGYTMRWMPSTLPSGMENSLWFDPKEGHFGSYGYKSALKETHIVSAQDTGYLFASCVN